MCVCWLENNIFSIQITISSCRYSQSYDHVIKTGRLSIENNKGKIGDLKHCRYRRAVVISDAFIHRAPLSPE